MADMNGEQAAAAPGNDATATEHEDVDAISLREALAAAEAEEAAGGLILEAEPAPKPQAPSGQTTQDQNQQPNQQPAMIPKARFDEVNGQRRHFEDQARAMAEEIARLKSGQPPQLPPEQREAQIVSELEALSKRYDDGDMSYSEMKKAERGFEAQLRAIHEEQVLSRIPKEAAPQTGESLHLQQETASLDEQFPYVAVLPKAELFGLRDRAIAQLQAEGTFTGQGGEAETLLLRRRVGELTEKFGPLILEGNDPVAQKRAAGKGQPQTAKPPQNMSPAATARSSKLELAADMPTPIDQLSGGTGGGDDLYSEESILRMTELEREGLPVAVRRKFLGV